MFSKDFSNLTGKILIASPYTMEGNMFHRSLIYVVHHGESGSAGFIFNRLAKNTPANQLFQNLDPEIKVNLSNLEMHIGGQMDLERGFFLHSAEYEKNVLFRLENSNLAISSNLEILKDIAEGAGPSDKMFIVGFTGWGPGEMEAEIENNLWIVSEPDEKLMFKANNEIKWSLALAKLGMESSDFAPPFIAHC
jgi:putative transcriptional regulator